MGEIKSKDYETITAQCDECGSLSTFNRVDDIGDPGPYDSGCYVGCTECGRPFWVFGDAIDPAYELLLFDAEEHMRTKRYIPCVTSLTQAWEMFFATFAYSNYLYRPFRHDARQPEQRERLEALAGQLGDAIWNFTFDQLRNVLANTVVEEVRSRGSRTKTSASHQRRHASTRYPIPRCGRSCCNCKTCESANCETGSSTRTATDPVDGKSKSAATRSGSCTGRKVGWRCAPSTSGGWPRAQHNGSWRGSPYFRCVGIRLAYKRTRHRCGDYRFLVICRQLGSGGTRIRTGDTMIFRHIHAFLSKEDCHVPPGSAPTVVLLLTLVLLSTRRRAIDGRLSALVLSLTRV
jgi:hypothetical protein